MNNIEKLYNIDFKILIYHYNGPTANENFNYLTHAITFFDEFTSSRIKLAGGGKNQMELKSKLNDIKIGGTKLDKQKSEIINITSLSDVQDEIIKLYKDYSKITHNARYDATHGKGFRILTSKTIVSKITNGTCTSKSIKYIWKLTKQNPSNKCILCIQQKKLLKKYITI